jgi:hypothetical protein
MVNKFFNLPRLPYGITLLGKKNLYDLGLGWHMLLTFMFKLLKPGMWQKEMKKIIIYTLKMKYGLLDVSLMTIIRMRKIMKDTITNVGICVVY